MEKDHQFAFAENLIQVGNGDLLRHSMEKELVKGDANQELDEKILQKEELVKDLILDETAEDLKEHKLCKERVIENLIKGEAADELDDQKLSKERPVDSMIQDKAVEESEERTLWKERLRKEILEEEKERILNFVEFEAVKKMVEIEKLLEIGGKPAKLVLLPVDHANVPKLRLPLEQDSSLCYKLADTGNMIFSSPPTLDSGIKGSELESSLAKDNSAEKSKIPLEEAKTEEQASEENKHLRPSKKQKIGCTWSCPLCGVVATSETNLNNHFMGKKHKLKSNKVQKALNNGSDARKEMPRNGLPVKMQTNGKLFLVYKNGNGLWCNNNNCTFTCTSSPEMVVHLTESDHDVCENTEDVKAADN